MKTAVNIPEIRSKIMSAKKTKLAAMDKLNSILETEKSRFYDEFNSSLVTREIDSGVDSSNISNTLGGRGNLFTFIGFDSGSSPTEPVKELIRSIRFIRNSVKLTKLTFSGRAVIPSIEKFASVSRMPWESGRSWLIDIEKTISGLSAYLYGKFKTSRSGRGIQNTEMSLSASYRAVDYFRKMYTQFIKNIQR